MHLAPLFSIIVLIELFVLTPVTCIFIVYGVVSKFHGLALAFLLSLLAYSCLATVVYVGLLPRLGFRKSVFAGFTAAAIIHSVVLYVFFSTSYPMKENVEALLSFSKIYALAAAGSLSPGFLLEYLFVNTVTLTVTPLAAILIAVRVKGVDSEGVKPLRLFMLVTVVVGFTVRPLAYSLYSTGTHGHHVDTRVYGLPCMT